MALNDLLTVAKAKGKIGISEERLAAILPYARQYVSLWRDYPDLFVDFMASCGPQTSFNGLFYYQRVFIRCAIRHKYVYAVFPRAYSKSFLAVLVLMIRCILYPGAKLFVTSGTKGQAASIVEEKVKEICTLIPAFEKEIDYGPRKTAYSKDYVRICFFSGSYFDIVAAKESSRGKRRTGGLIEECVGVDSDILKSVIIPTTNISRPVLDGSSHPEESINKSQIYVTTAGWKNTYAYDKLIQILVGMITEPEKYCILGGTWRVPVVEGLQEKGFISDLKRDDTFDTATFDREYESRWAGTSENSFFNPSLFDKNRKINLPEYEYSNHSTSTSYYMLSIDIGRKGASTEIFVFKVIPQISGESVKAVVNIFTYDDMHIEDQVIEFKRLYYKYKARYIVIDGNGIGINYIDLMVKTQYDAETGLTYPDFGIMNDEENYYKKYQTENCEGEVIYIIKAHAATNTEMYTNTHAQLKSGRVRLLLDERTAKAKLLDTKRGQKMSSEERNAYLAPFVRTTQLKEQMLNLREETEGINIILKQANKGIKKDKFSAFIMGLYFAKKQEEGKRKKRASISSYMFMN